MKKNKKRRHKRLWSTIHPSFPACLLELLWSVRGIFNFMHQKLGINTRTLQLNLSIEDKVATTTESIKFFWLKFLGHLTQTNKSNIYSPSSLLLFTVIFSIVLHFDKNNRTQRQTCGPEGILWWTTLLCGCHTATKADLPIILELLLAEWPLFLRSNTANHILTAHTAQFCNI